MQRFASLLAQRSLGFGLGEVLLVAAILGFGAFVLLADGRASPEAFRSGLDTVISR